MGVEIRRNGTSSTTFPGLNAPDSTLAGIDCPICHNTGTITKAVDGVLWSRECECMSKRRTMRNIRNSGLANLCDRYTFEAYKAYDGYARAVKEKAMQYATATGADWFYICGRPGSGKTHICIAICNTLLERGREVKYMLWREVAPQLKSAVNDAERYKAIMQPLKYADVLYIDDFLKGNATDADVNIAFELLNFRYNNSENRTIISTERTLDDVLSIDEAVGSRIGQRSRGYIITSPRENRRLT